VPCRDRVRRLEGGDKGGVFVARGGPGRGRPRTRWHVSADIGGGPRGVVVAVVDGKVVRRADFLGWDDPAFRGRVAGAMGDVNADAGRADLVVSAGVLGGPRVGSVWGMESG